MLDDLQESDWRWPHFTRNELKCKGSGECRMAPAFLDKLELLRIAIDKPMPVTSGYRSPAYNQKVAETGAAGPHTTGRAVDIGASGPLAYQIIKLAMIQGFSGVGADEVGAHHFVHLDTLMPEDGFPMRPNFWTYTHGRP